MQTALTNVPIATGSNNATVSAKLVSTDFCYGVGYPYNFNQTSGPGVFMANVANTGEVNSNVVYLQFINNETQVGGASADIQLSDYDYQGNEHTGIAQVAVAEPFEPIYNGSASYPMDTTSPPVWLKLVESGTGTNQEFTGYYSLDGVNWTSIGSTPTGNNPGAVHLTNSTVPAGVFSGCEAGFSNLSVSPLLFTTPPEAGGSTAPATLTGTTCQLATQGTSSVAGPITYNWSTTTMPLGVETPTFSVNGNSVAQGTADNTTVTFYAAGTYVFTATLVDSANNVATNTVTVVVVQTPTLVVVTPALASVPEGSQQSFSAMCYDQFGNPLVAPGPDGEYGPNAGTDPLVGFAWTATAGTFPSNPNGNDSSSNTLTAPGSAGADTITATCALAGFTTLQGTDTISVVGPASAPVALVSLTATTVYNSGLPSDSEIDLTWPNVSGATGYNIYRGTTAGGESTTAIATNYSPGNGATTTYKDQSSLGSQTTYYYYVAAVNASGTGPMSPEASVRERAPRRLLETQRGRP